MPAGSDPDDVIRHDADRWQQLIENAQPLVDFYFHVIAEQFDLQSAQGKGAAVTELAPLIAELSDEIEQQHYIQRLSRLVQIDEQTVAGRVRAVSRTLRASQQRDGQGQESADRAQRPRVRTIGRKPIARQSDSEQDESFDLFNAEPGSPGGAERADQAAPAALHSTQTTLNREDYLLASLLCEPDLLIWLAGTAETLEIAPLTTGDFQTVENQEIFRALKQFITSDEQWDLELFQEMLTSHLHGRLAALLGYIAQQPQRTIFELREHTVKVLLQIRIEKLKAEFRTSKHLHEEAQREGLVSGDTSLYTNHNHNLREQSHLGRVLASLHRLSFGSEHPVSKIAF
jgi:DNA primase